MYGRYYNGTVNSRSLPRSKNLPVLQYTYTSSRSSIYMYRYRSSYRYAILSDDDNMLVRDLSYIIHSLCTVGRKCIRERVHLNSSTPCMRWDCDGQGRWNRPKARKPHAGTVTGFTIAVTCWRCRFLCGLACKFGARYITIARTTARHARASTAWCRACKVGPTRGRCWWIME